jgi:hypothetical protein
MRNIRLNKKFLFAFIAGFLFVVVTVARLFESSMLQKTAREYFELDDFIDRYSVNLPWTPTNPPVVLAHISERKWHQARARLINYYGSATSIDIVDPTIRAVIVDQVGIEKYKQVLIFTESDPIYGVTYCVIGHSNRNDPVLFFVVLRI